MTPPAAVFAARANAHIQGQRYRQALSEIESAITQAPGSSEYFFLYCMLLERTGEQLAVAKRCYAEVVDQLSQKKPNGCAADMNCVVADLMAEGAQAAARAKHFLYLPASEVESEMRHYLLDDFDRGAYLNTILPAE